MPGAALHLSIDVEAVGRAIDVPLLDVHPRALDELLQIRRRGGFLRLFDAHPGENDGRPPAVRLHDQRAAGGHGDDARHRGRGVRGAGE